MRSLITHYSSLRKSDSGLTRNTRGSGYRCSVPGLAEFTEPALCGARSLMIHCRFPLADCRLRSVPGAVATGLKYIPGVRSEEHTSELQSRQYLVCRLLLEKKKL